MSDILKLFSLWKYVVEDPPQDSVKRAEWDKGNDLCMKALHSVVDGLIYHDIKKLTTAKACHERIVEICKPRRWSQLMRTFLRFDTFKASECASVAHYGGEFLDIIDELNMFSGRPTMDENWLIFKYFSGLPDSARSWINRWCSEHEPFNDDGTAKHKLTIAFTSIRRTVVILATSTQRSRTRQIDIQQR